MTGTVRKFDVKKGWGFIAPDGDERDVFVHFLDIQDTAPNGFRVLYTNDVVSFDVAENAKGPRATNVRIMERAGRQ